VYNNIGSDSEKTSSDFLQKYCTSINSMSASIIVIPPTSSNFPDASAARKRRREILASQRQALESTTTSSVRSTNYTGVFHKKPRRVSDLSDTDSNLKPTVTDYPISTTSTTNATNTKKKVLSKKKPQMKYDPDVPMSKEEAAAWRREQRRKRNRESAALSRQRQRDRIGDLEVEVEEWKTKAENILKRIKCLEDATGVDSKSLVLPSSQENNVEQSEEFESLGISDSTHLKLVSPPSSPSPGHPSLHDDMKASPITSSCAKTVVDAVVDQVLMGIESYEQEFSDNMISRHATS